MTAAKAHTSIHDQQAAAQAEGIFVPTTEQMRLIRRHADLAALVKKHKEEMDAIEDTLKAEMSGFSAEKLHIDGRNVAQWVSTTKRVLDAEALRAANPAVVLLYEQAKQQFDTAAAPFIRAETQKHARFLVKPAK